MFCMKSWLLVFWRGKCCWFTNKRNHSLLYIFNWRFGLWVCVSISEPPTEMLHFNGKSVDFWSLENFEEHVHRDYFLKCLLGCLSLEEFFFGLSLREWICAIVFLEDFFSSKDLEQLHILFGNQTMQIFFWWFWEDFPYKKGAVFWVGNSSSTLVDKGGYDPTADCARRFSGSFRPGRFQMLQLWCVCVDVQWWGFVKSRKANGTSWDFLKYRLKSEVKSRIHSTKKLEIHPF